MKYRRGLILLPVAGILLYVVLYVVATLLYPGGSQADKNSVGFSWVNNYWCNLLNEKALNGEVNAARPVAVSAMLVLCVSLSLFWVLLPRYAGSGKWSRVLIPLSGLLAMLTALLLFTGIEHDLVINLASSFGLVATIGTMVRLYRRGWRGLFVFGIVNLLLVVANNYFYHVSGMIVYLPLVQKISFASFLLWFCLICIRLYRAPGNRAGPGL